MSHSLPWSDAAPFLLFYSINTDIPIYTAFIPKSCGVLKYIRAMNYMPSYGIIDAMLSMFNIHLPYYFAVPSSARFFSIFYEAT